MIPQTGEVTASTVHMPGANLPSFLLMVICFQIKEQSLLKSLLKFFATLVHMFVVYIWERKRETEHRISELSTDLVDH